MCATYYAEMAADDNSLTLSHTVSLESIEELLYLPVGTAIKSPFLKHPDLNSGYKLYIYPNGSVKSNDGHIGFRVRVKQSLPRSKRTALLLTCGLGKTSPRLIGDSRIVKHKWHVYVNSGLKTVSPIGTEPGGQGEIDLSIGRLISHQRLRQAIKHGSSVTIQCDLVLSKIRNTNAPRSKGTRREQTTESTASVPTELVQSSFVVTADMLKTPTGDGVSAAMSTKDDNTTFKFKLFPNGINESNRGHVGVQLSVTKGKATVRQEWTAKDEQGKDIKTWVSSYDTLASNSTADFERFVATPQLHEGCEVVAKAIMQAGPIRVSMK